MSCETCYKCFEVEIPECPSEMLVKAGLEAITTYYVTIIDKFGESYKQQCVSDSLGKILVQTSGLPLGSLNRHSGNWTIEVRKSFSNCEPELMQFCCNGTATNFQCIVVSFAQSSLGSLPTDIGCTCNDPINPAPPSGGGDDSIEVAFTNQTTVTYTHNLGRYVDVTIYDTNGNQLYGQVIQNSLNQITVTFNQPLSGKILID